MNTIGSLGVGVQSSALYFMSSMGILPKLDMFIFADTGGEKIATLQYYEYMLDWQQKNKGLSLYRANYKNLEVDLLNSSKGRFASIPGFTLNDDGKKGMLKRQCTNEYKIAQVNKKYREILKIGDKNFPITEVWQGISSEERTRMVIPREKWKVHVYPFCGYKIYPDGNFEKFKGFEKTRDSIKNWLQENGFLIPEKSSCKFCPFQSDANWNHLKTNYPNDFEDACKIDESIRNSTKKGIKNPIYLHDSLQPLRSLEFKTHVGFFNDHGNCSDMCDV